MARIPQKIRQTQLGDARGRENTTRNYMQLLHRCFDRNRRGQTFSRNERGRTTNFFFGLVHFHTLVAFLVNPKRKVTQTPIRPSGYECLKVMTTLANRRSRVKNTKHYRKSLAHMVLTSCVTASPEFATISRSNSLYVQDAIGDTTPIAGKPSTNVFRKKFTKTHAPDDAKRLATTVPVRSSAQLFRLVADCVFAFARIMQLHLPNLFLGLSHFLRLDDSR
jgi:hypothetical protein